MTVIASTVSGNSASFAGAGILHFGMGTLEVNGSTVTGNQAVLDGAAGIQNGSPLPDPASAVRLRNSVVAANAGGPDCVGPADASPGFNLDGDGTCVPAGQDGNLTGAPGLGRLEDRGGPTPTHAPLPGSPLLDAGNPAAPGSGTDACSSADQRGVARPQGSACDIGAFELADGQACAGGPAADRDGDGLRDADDLCPGAFNPSPGPVLFDLTLFATAPDTYAWAQTRDVRWVRGGLAGLADLATDDGGALAAAVELVDGTVPAAGAGFYYLLRIDDCPVASWQTAPDAEPERDLLLP